jgi:hypothetical protein
MVPDAQHQIILMDHDSYLIHANYVMRLVDCIWPGTNTIYSSFPISGSICCDYCQSRWRSVGCVPEYCFY